jgi:hypothetical protein
MRTSWKWIVAVAIVVGIAVGATAVALVRNTDCGSTPTASPTAPASTGLPATPPAATAMTREGAAEAYRAAVAPVNVAQAAFYARAQRWNASTVGAQAASEAQQLVAAFGEVQSRLREIAKAYAPAASNVDAGVAAVAAVQSDLLTLDRLNAELTVSSWALHYDEDITELIAASNTVRSDLGLPPVARASSGGQSIPV